MSCSDLCLSLGLPLWAFVSLGILACNLLSGHARNWSTRGRPPILRVLFSIRLAADIGFSFSSLRLDNPNFDAGPPLDNLRIVSSDLHIGEQHE